MNDQIKELYNRAVNEASEEMREWHTQWNHKPPLFDYEKCLYGKFAESIIKEVLNISDEVDTGNNNPEWLICETLGVNHDWRRQDNFWN